MATFCRNSKNVSDFLLRLGGATLPTSLSSRKAAQIFHGKCWSSLMTRQMTQTRTKVLCWSSLMTRQMTPTRTKVLCSSSLMTRQMTPTKIRLLHRLATDDAKKVGKCWFYVGTVAAKKLCLQTSAWEVRNGLTWKSWRLVDCYQRIGQMWSRKRRTGDYNISRQQVPDAFNFHIALQDYNSKPIRIDCIISWGDSDTLVFIWFSLGLRGLSFKWSASWWQCK